MTFDEWWAKRMELLGRPPEALAMQHHAEHAWEAATEAERRRQEQHRADPRNYLKAPLEGDGNGD